MSRITRVYLPPSAFFEETVTTDRETSHYLCKVLRLRQGDRWAALNGKGASWLCEFVDSSKSRRVGDWKAVPALPIRVEVGLALCKGSRFEDALEKLAELGAENVVPLLTERTERFSPSPSKTKRWTQIAHSSSALANRLIPMSLAPTTDFNSFLSQPSPAELIYAHPDGQTPQELFQAKPAHYRILIGPEGGFSPNELNALQTFRARCLSLGPLTLRVETAAVCATSFALMGSSSV